jgi:hypothetical protein
MAGWHVDDEAFQLPPSHPLERIGHDGVVPAVYKRRPDVLDEAQELFLCFFPLLKLF